MELTSIRSGDTVVHPFIVNGKDIDPLSCRMEWKQCFPPKHDWIIHQRFKRPYNNPVHKLIKVVISNRIQQFVANGLTGNGDFEPVITDTSNQIEDESTTFEKSESTKRGNVSNTTVKRHKRAKKSSKKKQLPTSKLTTVYQTERAKTESDLMYINSENDVSVKALLKPKSKRKRRSKTSRVKKAHTHKQMTSKPGKYELPKIKTKQPLTKHVNTPHQKRLERFSFTTLPRLPIPDTWKWKSKSRDTGKWQSYVPQLPLPTSWKWYDNPMQFRKRLPQSCENSFADAKGLFNTRTSISQGCMKSTKLSRQLSTII